MRFNDFKYLTPIAEMAGEAISDLQNYLVGKIKELPADEQSVKTLREIEDLLRDVNAGGRTSKLNKDIQSVQDPLVRQAHLLLARYINQIITFGNATPKDREELFTLWKADQLVNLDLLLGNDLVGWSEIFNGYGSNPIIQELVDELMVISALGHGKGEFALSVLSKRINQPASGKGDLEVRFNGKEIKVEVKTADMGKDKPKIDKNTGQPARDKDGKLVMIKGKMSSARFGDQEVNPAPGYEAASEKLNAFVNSKLPKSGKLGGSGLNVGKAVELLTTFQPKDANILMGMIRQNVKLIFGKKFQDARPDYQKKLLKNINGILTSIEQGDVSSALQYWSRSNFNYYMAAKKDDGVLFVNIPEKTTIYYNTTEDLQGVGLRFRADTTYISGNDPKRNAYPQIQVVAKDYGAEKLQPEVEKLSKPQREYKTPTAAEKALATRKQEWINWSVKLADMRGIKDQRVIQKIGDSSFNLSQQGLPFDALMGELETQFPQLAKNVVRARQVPVAQRLYTPYVPPVDQPEEV
jgi:hypothetical protein